MHTSSSAQPQPISKLSILFKSSLFGVLRGIIGLPIQHPFDTIKTNMQAYQTDLKHTILQIYKNKGITGFYSGFFINVFRVISRQFYRWPLQISLFGYYGKIFGDKINRATLGMICGVNIAVIEVGIITPFQRLKVWLMTATKTTKIREFFYKLTIKRLFDGMVPVLIKQTIAWVSFLGATEYFKELAYKYSKKDRLTTSLNSIEILTVSFFAAIVNTMFVMPIDCVKTFYQKNQTKQSTNKNKNTILQQNISNQIKRQNNTIHNTLNNSNKKSKLMTTIQDIYKLYGWKGFFKGWQVKLVQYGINSFFMVVLFQDLLKEYEIASKEKKEEYK